MLPTGASLLLTENCNLACSYCFENKGRNKAVMSEEVAKAALEFLSENALKEHKREFSVIFFGGEPLLNINLIDYVFHTGKDIAEDKGLKFKATLITNATVMNDKIFEVLNHHWKEADMMTQLSIDGDKESQDLYRVTKSGEGSFALVEKNIERFKEIYKNAPHKLCVHSCISSRTVKDMYHNYRFFREKWGVRFIWFLPVAEDNWTDEAVKLYEEQYELIYRDIVRHLEETKDAGVISEFAPLDRCFNSCFADKPCAAGDGFVSITANGDIYPCHQFYFNNASHDLKFGNVLTGGIDNEEARKPFAEYNQTHLNCGDCKNINCFRCIANNYTQNGDMLEQIKGRYCELMAVDRKYQEKLKEKANELGLVRDSRENRPACLCNARNSSSYGRTPDCDIVNRASVCGSGNNPANPACLCDINYRPASGLPDVIDENNPVEIERDFKNATSLALRLVLRELAEIKEMLKQNGSTKPA